MFITVIDNLLRKKKVVNYKDHVINMLKAIQTLGCNINIKAHFLPSRLDRFFDNLADVNEKQGERFQEDIKVMEEWYQGRWNVNMMADYCWSI